jgi:hypothetical protein
MKTLIITFFIGVLAIVLFRFMYTHYENFRVSLYDPTCARGKYSLVTAGECTGTVDTPEYIKLSTERDIKYKDYDYNALRPKYDKWLDSDNKKPLGNDLDVSLRDIPIDSLSSDSGTESLNKISSFDLDYNIKESNGHADSSLSQRDIAILKKLASDKATPNEHSWPQKYGDVNKSSDATMKPGLSDCQKYYNCKNYDETCDDNCDDYEAQC